MRRGLRGWRDARGNPAQPFVDGAIFDAGDNHVRQSQLVVIAERATGRIHLLGEFAVRN